MRKILKNCGKKLMALALICVMILGVMPISMRQVKAGTNLTLTTESYGRQDWSDRYLFTISGVSDQADQYWNNNVAFIDGVAVTDGIHWAPGGGEDLLLLVYPEAFGATNITEVTGEHVIHIKSGTTLGNNPAETPGQGGLYTIANDLVYRVNGADITAGVGINMQFDSLAGCQDGALARYVINFSGFVEDGDIYWNNNTVYIDETNAVAANIGPSSGGVAQMYLPYDSIEAGKTFASEIGQHTLTIPAYTSIGNQGKYFTINEIVLDIKGDSVEKYVPTETVTLSDRPTDGSPDGRGFYFVTEPADSQPYDTSWGTNIRFSEGGVYVDGTLNESVCLKKIDASLWFVCLEDAGVVVEAGAKVTVDGVVKGTERKTVFMPQTFVFTGSEWNVYVPHVHTSEYHKAVPVTCTTDGTKEYWSCECGKLFSDEACETEITADDIVVEAEGHHATLHKAVPATCTTDGTKAYYTCDVCGMAFADAACETEIRKSETIPKHSQVYVKTVDATVAKTGMKAHYKCSCGKLYLDKACTKAVTKTQLTIAKKTVAKTSIKKTTAKSKALAVTWSKKSGVSGYEVQVSLKKSFKSGVKKQTVKGASKTSVTIKKLKAKKTYYVRIRSYQTVGGKKYYSSWSTVKSKKTK